MKIAYNWDDIRENLPIPGTSWGWGAVGLSDGMLCAFRDSGLIKRDPSGEHWMTTEKLWCYVIDRAGDNESVGTGGQWVLDVPGPRARTDTWRTGSAPFTYQVTLGGADVVKEEEKVIEEFERNDSKGTVNRDPGLHPEQLTLEYMIVDAQERNATWTRVTTDETRLAKTKTLLVS